MKDETAIVNNAKQYIIQHLTGFSNVEADTPAEAWARWLADDCMDCGYSKEELRNWLLDNGYKKLVPTNIDKVWLIKH